MPNSPVKVKATLYFFLCLGFGGRSKHPLIICILSAFGKSKILLFQEIFIRDPFKDQTRFDSLHNQTPSFIVRHGRSCMSGYQ